MICKSCKREIEDDSIYCRFCGEKQIRERKKKAEIKVPAPKQLPSGTWFNRVTVNGERVSISAETEKEYYAKARAAKAGLIEVPDKQKKMTLSTACKEYNKKRDSVLSPSTIRGYETIARTRFQNYMEKDIHSIDWQKMINDEAKVCKAKTIKNAWGYIRSVLKDAGVNAPVVTLPQIVPNELPWLEPEQIPIFLNAVKDKPCELAALFALHGLRRSELYALTPSKIYDGMIHVEGSSVLGPDGVVKKDTNKNESSRRNVKIRIPRLQELIEKDTRDEDEPYITVGINKMYSQINTACKNAGLPLVGLHGLRRSFASLAYSLGWSEMQTMKEGGWSDRETMNKKYIKLAEADAEKQSDSMTKFFENLKNGNENGNE